MKPLHAGETVESGRAKRQQRDELWRGEKHWEARAAETGGVTACGGAHL